MRQLGRALRDEVRRRFTTQGDGSWAPLSPWTVATTGRRKPLIGLRDRIHSRIVGDDVAEVYFDAPSDEWSIDMHDKGFISPAVEGKRMAWSLARPSAVGMRRQYISLQSRGASIIPARRVWLTAKETRDIVNAEVEAFARLVEAADA